MKKLLFLFLIVFAVSYSAQAQINYSNPEKVFFEAHQSNKLFFLIGQEEIPLYEKYYFAQLLKDSFSSFSEEEVRITNTGDPALYLIARDTQISIFTLDFVRARVAQIRAQITSIKATYSTEAQAQEYFKSLIRK